MFVVSLKKTLFGDTLPSSDILF